MASVEAELESPATLGMLTRVYRTAKFAYGQSDHLL